MILDIGCGSNPKGDINLDCFPNNFSQHGVHWRPRDVKNFVLADAHCLPFRSDVFDKIFLMAILEHLESPGRCVTEVKRVGKMNVEVEILIPQITSTARLLLKKMIVGFPFGVLDSFKILWQCRKFPKGLGHKSIVTPLWLGKHFKILSIRQEGRHSWFVGKKGKFLYWLGIRENVRRDNWRIVARL